MAESLVTGRKPNLDGKLLNIYDKKFLGVNIWKRATREGVCKGRSPVALYGWFMRYKSGKFKPRHEKTPSLDQDFTPSTPTTPGGVTVMVNAISSSEPLSLADLQALSSAQYFAFFCSLTFVIEILKAAMKSTKRTRKHLIPI